MADGSVELRAAGRLGVAEKENEDPHRRGIISACDEPSWESGRCPVEKQEAGSSTAHDDEAFRSTSARKR
jgi:hypothetical protein